MPAAAPSDAQPRVVRVACGTISTSAQTPAHWIATKHLLILQVSLRMVSVAYRLPIASSLQPRSEGQRTAWIIRYL